MLPPWVFKIPPIPVLLFVVLLTSSPVSGYTGNPIKCFNCSSWENAACLYVKANDTSSPFVHSCDDDNIPQGAEPFCRTITQTIRDGNGTKRLRRKCGWIKHQNKYNETPPCYDVSFKNHDERVCQCFDDLCNRAPPNFATFAVSTVTVILPLVYAFYHFK